MGIQIEPNGIIDFKNISIFEKGYVPIDITNNSLLPQKLLFQSKNPVLSVLNPKKETIITLKSREVVRIYLIFQPLEVTKYSGDNMKIIGYTDHGLKFEILCMGNGIQSALKLSSNYIKFSATSIGKINTTSIGLLYNEENSRKGTDNNKLQNIYDFKFGMPVLFRAQKVDIKQKKITDIPLENKNRIYDCLRITPNEGTINPDKNEFLEVSFYPTENDYNIEGGKADDELEKIGKIYKEENNENGINCDNNSNNNIDSEKEISNLITNNTLSPSSSSVQKSIKSKKINDNQNHTDSVSIITIPERSSFITNLDFIMPCKIKPHKNFNIDLSKLKMPFGMKTDINEKEYQQNNSFVIHLLISTSITQPDLVNDNKESIVNFGNVLLNSESICDIPFKNETDKPKKINMKCLNPVGPFDLVCYLREIPPKSTFNAKILFRPSRPILYKEICEFYTETSCIKLELYGTGIEPKVLIEPKNIEFNDIMLGEIGTQTLTINNQTTIPIKYKIHDKEDVLGNKKINGTTNINFITAFHLNSYEGEVTSMDKTDIIIKFSPDHESDNYYDYFYIEIIGIKEYQKIRVNGRCWQNSFYISGFDHNSDSYIEDPIILPLEIYANNNNCISSNLDTSPHEDEETKKKEIKKETKKEKKSESNTSENDEIIPITLASSFIQPKYKTLKFEWKISKSLSQKYNQTVYVIYSKDFSIVNGKVPQFVKTENKKMIPSEFIIQPYDNTFFVNNFGSVTLVPLKDNDRDSKRKFVVESTYGTTENVGVTRISVKIVDPLLNFWSNYFKEGINLSNHINEDILNTPDFKFFMDDYQNTVNRDSNNSVINEINSESINNIKASEENVENQFDNEEINNNINNSNINTNISVNSTISIPNINNNINSNSNSNSNSNNFNIANQSNNNYSDNLSAAQSITLDTPSKTHSNQKGSQNMESSMITLRSFNPEVIETCYKVILKGGITWEVGPTFNCREPAKEPVEGYINSYSRIWILKFITELPENPEIVD